MERRNGWTSRLRRLSISCCLTILFLSFAVTGLSEWHSSDARHALRISADLEDFSETYDLNGDGIVKANEARQILRMSADGDNLPASEKSTSALAPHKVEYTVDSSEATMIAKVMWGEARACSLSQRASIGWCILNRVDDNRFPNSVYSVITQPNQFYYSSSFPCTDENYQLARDVLTRWQMEKDGIAVERELPKGYYWYNGNGRVNIFRTAYSGGTYLIP